MRAAAPRSESTDGRTASAPTTMIPNSIGLVFCSTNERVSDEMDARAGKPIVTAKYAITTTITNLMKTSRILPYRRATDGRPSHNGCSGPGALAGATKTEPAPGVVRIPGNNCFPQCGHDAASVETCCPHS